MSKKTKLRRLKFLMHKHSSVHIDIKELAKTFFASESYATKNMKGRYELYEGVLEIHRLCEELNIDHKEMYIMWHTIEVQKYNDRQFQLLKPKKERKDNKGVKVGSGGSHRNKIRYPSKKRSRRVWKIFYEMFPMAAEADGWDGKTSKRMK